MCIGVRQFSIPDGVNISEQKGNKETEIKENYTNIEGLSSEIIAKLKNNFEQNKTILDCIKRLIDKFYTEWPSDSTSSPLTEVVNKLLFTRNTESIMLAIKICENHKKQLLTNTIKDIRNVIESCNLVASAPCTSIYYINTMYISGSSDTLEKIKSELNENFPKGQI